MGRPSAGRSDADNKFALELFAALVAACVLAWATGQLAGLLFARTWLRLGLDEMPWVVYGWARNWRDPAAAWPAEMRGLLPGPVGMYFCLAVVLAGAVALVCSVQRGRRRPGPRRLGAWRSARSAGWASRWQVRRLAVRHATGRLPDARAAVSRWWAAQPR